MNLETLKHLSQLLKIRDTTDQAISEMINRPVTSGHLGEFIASQIFNIELHSSASQKGSDGKFISGNLQGKTVNIKWYTKFDGLVDIGKYFPDYYLILTGEEKSCGSSKGAHYPPKITKVFLFQVENFIKELGDKKKGIATSVPGELWQNAEIFPVQENSEITLDEKQKDILQLFNW